MTCSAVKRGVPRSPNHYLNEFGIMRQFDFRRRKIKPDRLLDIFACFSFRSAGRRTARQFWTHRRPTFGDRIVFKDYTELHSASIRRPAGLFLQITKPGEGLHTRRPKADGLVRVAAQGKTQGCAHLLHSQWSEVSDTLTQALLRHGYRVVEIHGARPLHTIFLVQPHFGGNPSDAGRDRRNRRCGQVFKGAIAGQYYDWPSLVRRSKTVKPDVASSYSSGQIASASHPDRFPDSRGPPS